MLRKARLLIVLGVILAQVFLLCRPPIAFAERVVLMLRWDAQFQFAGYYEAQWQGYYAAAGLNVDIRHAVQPDGSILSAVREVEAGRADFGVGAADILLANGKGANLVVLASILQQSAAGMFALESTPMYSPGDLLQLRVARNINDLIDVEMQAMLRAEGFNPANVTAFPHLPGIDHLLDGSVDVIPGYSITVPYFIDTLKIKLRRLTPIAYGVDFYGDSLFCSRPFLDANPDLVKRFLQASLHGWEYALSHPEETARRLTAELDQVFPLEDELRYNLQQAREIIDLAHYPYVPLGHVNPARWRFMHDYLRGMGLIPNAFEEQSVFQPEREAERRKKFMTRIVLGILIAAAVIGGAAMLWAFILRHTVKRRTEQLQESREHYRTVADFTYDWEYWLGPDGRLLYVSPSCERISGYSAQEFYADPELMEKIMHPDDRKRYIHRLVQQKAAKRPDYIDLRITHKDGSTRWIGHTSQLVYGEHGSWLGERGSNRDITKTKQSQQRQEEVERMLRHDLRSPLVSLQAGLRLASDANISEEDKAEILSELRQSAQRLTQMLETFRRLNQMEEGRASLNLEHRNLAALVKEAVKDAGGDGEHNVQLALDGSIHVEVDVGLCRTLFINLICNALEAREDEPVSICVEKGSDGEALARIHNKGAVPPEVRDRFFEKYATAGKPHGTGLGAYSARLAARLHGGDVTMHSSEEEGTTVTVRLPRR